MPPQMPSPAAADDDVPLELIELAREVAAVTGPGQPALNRAFEQVVESVLRRRRILNLVQEGLSQLRLDIKYLMFDLEATRAERDALRKQLEGDLGE
ncbi:MAG: transcriptional regulator [Planctomycetaceae bacterium]